LARTSPSNRTRNLIMCRCGCIASVVVHIRLEEDKRMVSEVGVKTERKGRRRSGPASPEGGGGEAVVQCPNPVGGEGIRLPKSATKMRVGVFCTGK
jgi:hypothetical protein